MLSPVQPEMRPWWTGGNELWLADEEGGCRRLSGVKPASVEVKSRRKCIGLEFGPWKQGFQVELVSKKGRCCPCFSHLQLLKVNVRVVIFLTPLHIISVCSFFFVGHHFLNLHGDWTVQSVVQVIGRSKFQSALTYMMFDTLSFLSPRDQPAHITSHYIAGVY